MSLATKLKPEPATPDDPALAGAPGPSARARWTQRRQAMERRGAKSTPGGLRRRRHWDLFSFLIRCFGWALHALGLYGRGVENARVLRLRRVEVGSPDLPAAFDGFTILHLSDLHLDAQPDLALNLRRFLAPLEADLCVLTGDYRADVKGGFTQILPDLELLLAGVRAEHGVLGVLGNHDSADMVPAFEALGVTMLINETKSLRRDGACLQLTGTDDVHYFYSPEAREALARTPEGFKVALVHSPELAQSAADCGFQLYLTGHTHGGQVALPGGRPLITHLTCNRGFASGLWRCRTLRGYTSTGVGTSALPVRFNTRAEVVLVTLRSSNRSFARAWIEEHPSEPSR